MLRSFLKAFGLDWLLPIPFQILSAENTYALMQKNSLILVDVRKPDEWHETGIPKNSKGVTLSDDGFADTILELTNNNKTKCIALTCHAGNRSKEAAFKLHNAGFNDLISVDGGIVSWIEAELPTIFEIKESNLS